METRNKVFWGIMAVCAVVIIVDVATGPKSCSSGDPDPQIPDYTECVDYTFSIGLAEDHPGGEIRDDLLYPEIGFEQGKAYYLVLDFHISSFDWLPEGETFDAAVWFSPNYMADITIESAATGVTEQEEHSVETWIVTTYRVPEDRSPQSYRVVYKLTFQEPEPYIDYGFSLR